MALDDDADDLPSGPPPPPNQRTWRHPSELGSAVGHRLYSSARPRTGWLVAAILIAGSVMAVAIVGLVRELDPPRPGLADRAGQDANAPRSDPESPSPEVWLGVEGTDVEGQLGAVVTSVAERGPAAAAGVVAGDLIVAVGDRGIASFADLQEAIADHAVGDVVLLIIVRASAQIEMRCVVGERPAD